MQELRRDPILRQWVIMASERAADLALRRPEPVDAGGDDDPCPFCPGHESLNPIEIATVRDGGRWVVRATPDKQPLLRIEGDLERRGAGMFDVMNAIGAHEVVADTPDHRRQWADFSSAEMARLLGVYRARSNDLRRDARFRYVLVVKNHGAVWSRYPHAHSHVIATPFTPKRVEDELAGAREYFRMRERCVFCDQLSEELRFERRVIGRNAAFVSFAPFAAEHPFSVWVSPIQHAADFGTLPDAALPALAALLVDALARMRTVLGNPAYSVALHAGPVAGGDQAEIHWHWEIIPHLRRELGMEWATGIVSNPVPPEEAAAQLRAARAG